MKSMVNIFCFKKFWWCEINIYVVVSFIIDTGGFICYLIVYEVILELINTKFVNYAVGCSCIPQEL